MNYAGIISEILLLALIAVASFSDVRDKSIPIILPLAGTLTGIAFQIIFGELKWWEVPCGCLLGGLMLLLALITRESVGYGDGLMLVASGAFLGLFLNLFLLMSGLMLSAVFSGVLMIFSRKGKETRIPFQPFLLGGYVFLLAVVI